MSALVPRCCTLSPQRIDEAVGSLSSSDGSLSSSSSLIDVWFRLRACRSCAHRTPHQSEHKGATLLGRARGVQGNLRQFSIGKAQLVVALTSKSGDELSWLLRWVCAAAHTPRPLHAAPSRLRSRAHSTRTRCAARRAICQVQRRQLHKKKGSCTTGAATAFLRE